jgi:hypothetical protein
MCSFSGPVVVLSVGLIDVERRVITGNAALVPSSSSSNGRTEKIEASYSGVFDAAPESMAAITRKMLGSPANVSLLKSASHRGVVAPAWLALADCKS